MLEDIDLALQVQGYILFGLGLILEVYVVCFKLRLQLDRAALVILSAQLIVTAMRGVHLSDPPALGIFLVVIQIFG